MNFLSLEGIKKDFTEKIFNRLFVLGRAEDYISPKGKKQTMWWCMCNCPKHTILIVRGNNLTSGNSKSCGCLNIEKSTERIIKIGHATALDLTNQIFGELTALFPTEERKNGSVIWECQCSCGRRHKAQAKELKRHSVESCGCITESKGVRKIKRILIENNIPFEIEKTFLDCKFKDTNAYARYDFYINNQFLLEYDGVQHFEERDLKFFKDSLAKRKEHDDYKNEYAKSHNIPLKRISYKDYDNITLEMIMEE